MRVRYDRPGVIRDAFTTRAAGVIGFLGNELVARYRIKVGREIGSAALVADGLHARTDGFTSLAVVFGAAGVALGFPLADPLIGLLITVAILSMVIGTVVGLTQTDMKRMIAYSSVAHAGFILVGTIALTPAGLSGTLFYLLAYGFTTLAALGVISLVRDGTGEASHLSQWAGLGRRSPVVAGVFALCMLSLAGIPLTSGFISKFGVFSAAYADGMVPLVVVAVAALLLLAAPDPLEAVRAVRSASDAPDPTAPLVAVAALLAWLLEQG